jgi:FlaA1/EpsC-like NDP-sugar epimerase
MIRLSGKEPRLPADEATGPNDVRIKIVGVRPGEKLHEELWGDNESVGDTGHPKIMRLSRPPVDAGWLSGELVELERLADEGDTLEVVAKLGSIVREPTLEARDARGLREGVLRSAESQQTEAPPAASV